MSAGPQGVLDWRRKRWARARRRRSLGLWPLVELLESVAISPGQIVVGAPGEIRVVSEAFGEVGDRLDTVGVGGRDQGHDVVADRGTVLALIVERTGQIAHRDDERLLDEVRVERDAWHLAESGQPVPLVDDEGQRLPQRRVGLDQLAGDLLLAQLLQLLHEGLRVLSVIEHPIDGRQAERLGLVVVVEDLLVNAARLCVLHRVLVLDVAELQERVRVAGRLDQLVGGLVIEVLGGTVRALHQLGARDESMPEELIDDLSRMMAPRIEEDDRSVRRLPVQPRRVDAGPYVLRRLAEGLKRGDLFVDLLPDGDHHRAGVVDPEVRGLPNCVLLESLVQRQQEVVARIDEFPLVSVGHRHTPALVQRLEALERRSAEVVHDHQHRARRPVIPDVFAPETFVDGGWTVGSDDMPAVAAPRLLEVVRLSSEQRLADDADDHLLPIAIQLAEAAPLARRPDDSGRQRVKEVLCLGESARAVSTVSLGRLGVALVRLAIASGGRLGRLAAPYVCLGRRRAAHRAGAGPGRRRAPRRLAGIAGCGGSGPTRVPRDGRGRYDLGDHARLPPLGACYLIPDQGADERPVVGLELSVVDTVEKLAEFVQRDLKPLRPRAGFPTRLP